MEQFDVIIIGAGAAGLFCAAQAGQRGRRVLLLDNGKKPGRKILMSGGGRCNFTNLYTEPAAYLSHNPHFCKSALARYTQWDFIDLVNRHGIAWHEKTLGQLFCDDSAQQIVDLLLAECDKGNVTLRLRSEVLSVARDESGYTLQLNGSTVQAEKLVIASGGLSMPGLGATPFGYKIAEQFGLSVFPTRAALVPFTLHKPLLEQLQTLSGVALETTIDAQDGTRFKEAMLFTHRGLSGPAVLQISSYWLPGEFVTIDLSPATPLEAFLTAQREAHPESQPEEQPGEKSCRSVWWKYCRR
ncbi:anaerobic glycerol-3-phosphate dehydrogenase subunit B [Pantoea agglomerans]|uniref:Anaerobic glycerol-3-phosphate dehydrogenase subunit B n=1 Tax=Enterobacter agglomerans TaxID=549 RepID=A0A379AAA4_ENTAG|nr:anaerobic glycerol-3-phosphate dehydrogenase subunit B [Pantoea agglomerans]